MQSMLIELMFKTSWRFYAGATGQAGVVLCYAFILSCGVLYWIMEASSVLPFIATVFGAIWLGSATIVVFLAWYESRLSIDDGSSQEVERDVHDGSSPIAGVIIAIMLGPIGVAMYLIDLWNRKES